MKKLIKDQLQKCKVASIPYFDENTTHLIIPKITAQEESECLPGHYYLIELEDYIVNEPSHYTLSSNWNKGTKPSEHRLKIDVIQLLGKMVQVNSIGDSNNIPWTGWLPLKSFKIIKEL